VRSNPRFLKDDRKKGLGLVLERKRLAFQKIISTADSLKCATRMNVAITRAKELLVVIGNAVMLSKHDPYWKALLQFALRHKLYVLFLSKTMMRVLTELSRQVRRSKTFPRNGWQLYLEIGVSYFVGPQIRL